MGAIGDLIVRIGADISSLKKNLSQAEREMEKRARKFNQLGDNLSVGLTLPIVAAGTAAVQQAAKFETLETSLATMLGSASEAKDLFKDLQEFSSTTPFQLGDIADSTKKLLAFGFSVDEAKMQLQNAGDIAAATGTNLGDLTMIIGKARATNQVFTEDLNQLAERGIPIYDLLKERFNVTGVELRKMVEKGQIDFKILQDELRKTTEVGGLFYQGMEKQSKTLAGLFSTLKDNAALALAEIGNELVNVVDLKEQMKLLTDQVIGAVKWFAELDESTKANILRGVALLAVLGPMAKVLASVNTVGGFLVGTIKTGITVFQSAAKAFQFLNAVMIANPILAIVSGIALLVTGLVVAYQKVTWFRGGINGLAAVAKEVFAILKESVMGFVQGFQSLKDGDFRKAARSFREAINKSNPIGIAFGQGKRLANAYTDAYQETIEATKLEATPKVEHNLDQVQKDIAAVQSKMQKVADISPPVQIPVSVKSGASSANTTEAMPSIAPMAPLAAIVSGGALPEAVSSLETVSESVQRLKQTYAELTEKVQASNAVVANTAPYEKLKQVTQSVAGAISGSVGSGITNLKDFAKAALQASADVVRGYIVQGIAAVLSKSLQTLGPIGILIGGAAAGVAGTLFNTLISQFNKAPALATGGLAYGPTMALVGDNPGASVNPEVIAPLDKLTYMIKQAVGGGRMSGTLYADARGIQVAVEHESGVKSRARGY